MASILARDTSGGLVCFEQWGIRKTFALAFWLSAKALPGHYPGPRGQRHATNGHIGRSMRSR
jgi:hypothetical protein